MHQYAGLALFSFLDPFLHVAAILDKLGVETRLAAAAEVRRWDEKMGG